MGKSILVFISHSSEDKEDFIEPIVSDLEDCFINVWLDKRKILPGDNLRKSIFRDGLDKADIALISFTEKSLKSSWVYKEIKHVLREETKKGNNFDLNKIISIFDSKNTYEQIAERYPELTDDLMHLMPKNYTSVQLGQLISAIWSKYLSLQGGDVETQKQFLAKEKELFQKDKEIQSLKIELNQIKNNSLENTIFDEFKQFKDSGKIDDFINIGTDFIAKGYYGRNSVPNLAEVLAFGLAVLITNTTNLKLTQKGLDFFKWLYLNE